MAKLAGALAAGIGHLVRLLILVWPAAMRTIGFGLMVWSVSMFDERLAVGFAGLCLFVFAMQIRSGVKR